MIWLQTQKNRGKTLMECYPESEMATEYALAGEFEPLQKGWFMLKQVGGEIDPEGASYNDWRG